MGRRLVLVLITCILLSSLLYARFNHVAVKASGDFPVHDLDTGFSYATIQEAIDAPETQNGQTIFVEAGMYYEHVTLNKSLTLKGEDLETTIIDGDSRGIVVNVIASNVSISGFTIRSSGGDYPEGGILLNTVRNCSVCYNKVTGNYRGIFLNYSSNNIVAGNNVTDNGSGILLITSPNNIIFWNSITANQFQYGMFLSPCAWSWDGEGNYWGDYNGTDTDNDGIGNSPYDIGLGYSYDYYPLVGEFDLHMGGIYTICNSTISDFKLDLTNLFVRFNVTGLDGTAGFCRICVPHALLTEPYNVTIDGAEPLYANYNLRDNGTHRWMYFLYLHSTHEVIIIPEFPTLIVLPIFMMATLLVVILYKRKLAGSLLQGAII